MRKSFRWAVAVLSLTGLLIAGSPMAAAPRARQAARPPATLFVAAKQLLLRLKCSITSRLSPPLPGEAVGGDDPSTTLLPATTT